MQLVHAFSILLSSSIDVSVLPNVLEVLQAGNDTRYSPRETSSAVLYVSELFIFRCEVAAAAAAAAVVINDDEDGALAKLKCSLLVHSVMFKAIYDHLLRTVPLCPATDELPEIARMLLQLRCRLEAILGPFAAGRRLRLHGMSAVDLNGSVVEVMADGKGVDGRVAVRIIENTALTKRYANGLRVKSENLESL
jgi:hypothetical protein